ncbi:unnamed protein product [Onchocerca flexuosa]|uniref:Uncharacterized protein n=1 Tax=Onchocerca flexuosa TaxID=387005 RepID=A0A183HQC6_9BILA|nr:unnamed protein product [Onchocerca flexuosa]
MREAVILKIAVGNIPRKKNKVEYFALGIMLFSCEYVERQAGHNFALKQNDGPKFGFFSDILDILLIRN